jgi:predicted DNA-binding transcriptional regulator YafY
MSDERRRRQLSLLQKVSKGRTVLAGAFAEEQGVSLRTIYRDVEDLIAHGVRVKGTRGPDGGYSLDPGAVELVALQSPESLEAFLASLAGGPGGMWSRLETAAALVGEGVDDPLADAARSRLHFDKSDWYWRSETPRWLPELRRAAFSDLAVELAWSDRGGDARRGVLLPYGLVWRGGHWYVVVAPDDGGEPFRIRITRVESVTQTSRRFERPAGFDLAHWWEEHKHAYGRGSTEVDLRVAPDAHEFLQIDLKDDSRVEPMSDGWTRVRLFVDRWEWLVPMIAPYGSSVLVDAPTALRAAIIALHREALAAYEGEEQHPRPRPATDDTRLRASHGQGAD